MNPRALLCLVFCLTPVLAGCDAIASLLESKPQPSYVEPPAGTYAARTFEIAPDVNAAPETVAGAEVSLEFFTDAKVQPLLGRAFIASDAISSIHVAVLSQDLWVRRFGSDPGIIGRQVSLDGRLVTVVGVMPSGFTMPKGASIWIPR